MANLINKGIRARVTARGGNFVEGKEYSCTLYYSAKSQDGRATAIATATNIMGDITCEFVFEPNQTAQLKAGNVILEIFDTNTLEKMYFVDNYATVRANSLSS